MAGTKQFMEPTRRPAQGAKQEASKGDPLVAYLEISGGDWAPQEAWPEASGGSRWNSLFHSYTAVIWILVFNEWPGSPHIPSFL